MIDLVALFLLASVQNAAFTWVSRSRNSGDVKYHAVAAVFSNGVWFLTQVLIWTQLWERVTAGEYMELVVPCLVYVSGTTLGSCLAMAHLLKSEKGKRRVGAR